MKGQRVKRLQIVISENAHAKLREFAPEWGDGAVIDHMILCEAERRARKAGKDAGRTS